MLNTPIHGPLNRTLCVGSLRTLLLASLAATALAAPAAQAAGERQIEIAAGSLEGALRSLAAQTGDQLVYDTASLTGRRAPALSGRFTAQEALARLLATSDVSITRAGPKVFVLKVRPPAGHGGLTGAAASAAAPAPRPFVDSAGGPAPELSAISTPAPARPANLPATTLEAVQVTGSHIRGARTASPLVVVTHADLERSGYATLAGALAALPQAFGAGASEGTLTTGADRVIRNVTYGASVNLRGLGPSATLTLVDGRRLSGSGSFGDFTDISSIPTAAVERVEILLDGASALYGADAVGGVVNIILRKRLQGGESKAYAGIGTRGEPAQVVLSQSVGHDWATGGMLFAFEYQKRDALRAEDRPYTASSDLRPLGGHDQRITNAFPGNILRTDPATGRTVPGWAIPVGQTGIGLRPQDLQEGVANLQNQRAGVDTLPRQVLQSAYLTARQTLGERLELSADVRYAFRKYGVRVMSPVSNLTVGRANPYFVSPNGSATDTIAYSFAQDLDNPLQLGSAQTWAVSGGGKADLPGDWRGETYLGFAQEITEARTTGAVNVAFLNEALGNVPDRPETAFSTARDGFFNPFAGTPGANSPAIRAFIGSGWSSTRNRITAYVASAQADGSLLELPGGTVKLALGGQVRRETLYATGANFGSTVAPVPQQLARVGRRTVAGFAELRAPLIGPENAHPGLRRLELSLAGRVERYDDVGTTANPKLGVLWEPVEGLSVRGTYGRSFRAPALREVQDVETYSPILLSVAGGARVRTLQLTGGNPGLSPETATSWTLGFDLRPPSIPGLVIAVTGFDIDFHNRIDRPVSQSISTVLIDPALASFVTRISPATNPADLAYITALINSRAFTPALGVFPPEAYVAVIDNRYVNTATLKVRGLDASVSYRLPIGGGALALAANGTWMIDYKQQITPTSRVIDRVGVAGNPVKLRARLTADWTQGHVTVGGAFNYVHAYRDALGIRIADQPTFDLQLRLAPRDRGFARGLAVAFTVRNLFDRAPPFYDNTTGVAYDPTNADPVGRFAALQLTRAW